MKRFFQCLGLMALLALIARWLMEERQPSEAEETRPTLTVQEPMPRDRDPSALMALKASILAERPVLRDRFADCPVLEQREKVGVVDGRTWVRRWRLVKDERMKHPLLRLEEELVRTGQGDKLVRQQVTVGDHVTVKLHDPNLDEAELQRELGDASAVIRRRMPASGLCLVAFDQATLDTVPEAVSRLAKMTKQVRLVEPDSVLHVQTTPNDPSYSSLWGLHNSGQSGGLADADIDAPEAWSLSTGSGEVTVAVLDTGLDATHPDLAANLWVNAAETAGNGVDDDGNGYVDDIRGWDFVNHDNLPQDDNGHGTHCAGTIGAVGNNGVGLTGVCWRVSLLALKFLDASGYGFASDAAEAISYATDLGVTLTSNSYTDEVDSQVIEEAVEEASAAGILFVAAAGNNSRDVSFFPEYPAAYSSPLVLSVTSTTRTDGLSGFANYSAVSVDLAAPGSDIYSTLPGGAYGLKSGTSMATPHVAGACALMKSFKPELTMAQIRDLLLNTVDVLPGLSGKCVSGGRLNLYNALLACDDILATPTATLSCTGPLGGPFTPAQQTLVLTNHGSTAAGWTAAVDRSWLTLSASSGTLAAGDSTTVLMTINAQANQLLSATHRGAVTITSTATGRVQTRLVSLQVTAGPLYVENLDLDPGWSRTGQWQHGIPQGQGGTGIGYPDPLSGATGTKVFGINLAGNYDVNQTTPQYLTAGPFDLSGKHGTQLLYQRWLNMDSPPWAIASVEVSTDGENWSVVWDNSVSVARDMNWVAMQHDLSAWADGQSQVYVRWGHEITLSYAAYALSGWNIDDVELRAVPDRQLRVQLPTSLREGGAAATATVQVAPAAVGNVVIQLASNRPGEEVTLPASVTILAGQTEASFTVTPINDTRLDGTQSVVITATAVDWPSHSASMPVHDNESAVLTVTLPATVTEGGAPVANQARVSLPAAVVVAVEVPLASGNTAKLGVPASVTIPAGQSQAFFTLTMPDDAFLDGPQNVMVTAAVNHWPTSTASVQVLDNEAKTLSVSLPATRLESAGVITGAASVSVSGILLNPLTVTLHSNDLSELTVPASVVIPAGVSSQVFDLILVNDPLYEGAQTVQVSASAVGFSSGQASMLVSDDEEPALPAQPQPAHDAVQLPPESDLTWGTDVQTGGVPESYVVIFGTAPVPVDVLGTVTSTGMSLPRLEPGMTYSWQVIAQRGGQSRPGPIWRFSVAPVGDIHHFGWTDVPAVVARGSAFMARITALDVWDNPIPGFSGPVALSALTQPAEVTTGTGSFTWSYPLGSLYHDGRTQSIYTPSELGPAGQLNGLSLDVSTPPGATLNELTIRLKATQRSEYVAGSRTWDGDGWVTVFSGPVSLTTTGWTPFAFSTPFAYDGLTNLLVDISFDRSAYSSHGYVRSSITTTQRSLVFRTDSAHGAPTSWSGAQPPGEAVNVLPNLRFSRAAESQSLTPVLSGSFENGSWSGLVTLPEVASDLWLVASLPAQPTIQGLSTTLDVVAVNDLVLNAEPLFTGGTSNGISWPSLGAGYEYEVQRATMSHFGDAVSTGFISSSQHTYTGLTDGQLYHYRGRARRLGLVGDWSEPQRSTQDAMAPVLTLTPMSGGVVLADHLTLQGTGADASGLAAIAINGSGVVTSNAFANWTQPLTALSAGINHFTIVATDHAEPPNTRTETWTILHLPNADEDADHNGVPALLEYAFEAHGSTAVQALPSASQIGGQWLLSYRRRLMNPSQVQYHLETSTTLSDWQPAGAQAEEISAVPTGDGITETVTVRVMPALSSEPLFVRIRVEVP